MNIFIQYFGGTFQRGFISYAPVKLSHLLAIQPKQIASTAETSRTFKEFFWCYYFFISFLSNLQEIIFTTQQRGNMVEVGRRYRFYAFSPIAFTKWGWRGRIVLL